MTKITHEKYSEWKQIPWKSIELHVDKLQNKIYYYSSMQNRVRTHEVQQMLIHSYAAKLLATRRVTQDNKGKKTAGIDGKTALTPTERLQLANTLKLGKTGDKIRRVWIPKPGKKGQRPLGIPTIKDRATQALLLLALEPEWEAKFEPNSYGFRPGRSAHDAIEAIYISINRKSKYVLDADIEKCFDSISHTALLQKLQTFPSASKQIKAWLKAGVLDGLECTPINEQGTPQGGIISPLLSNIALHGVEFQLKKYLTTNYGQRKARGLTVVRYADDIIVLYQDLHILQELQQQLEIFLSTVGLKMNTEKTTIKHTFEPYQKLAPGFDYLGFQIKQYEVGKYKRGKKGLPFKTLIMPTKENVQRHLKGLKEKMHIFTKPEALLTTLNPKILGWSNYFRTVVSARIFGYCDHIVVMSLIRALSKKHPTRGLRWIFHQYFSVVDGFKWTMVAKYKNAISISLRRHSSVKILRHTKVLGTKSPYDGDTVYWMRRRGQAPNTSPTLAKCLKKQNYKCGLCGGWLKTQDLLEIDHVVAQSQGGLRKRENVQVVHRHCHHTKRVRP